ATLDLKDAAAAINKHNEDLEAQAKPLRDKLAATPETDKSNREELQKQIKAKRQSQTHGLLMTDNAANVAAMHVLFQGDYKVPRDPVEAGIPSVFDPG